MEYSVRDPISGPGWAIQQLGPWVLGFWNETLDEERISECRRMYRAARLGHTRFAVLAAFAGYPFHLDVLRAESARKLAIAVFEENAASVDALIFPLLGTGMKGSVMRLAAASVVQATRTRVPLFFPADLDGGIAIARDLQLFQVVPESEVRAHMHKLEELARW